MRSQCATTGAAIIGTGRCIVAKTTLVVEDDADVLTILGESLKRQGHAAVCVRDGDEALKWARSAPPDLIVLDRMLPVMSGYDVRVALKGNPATASIPIVGISAKARPEDVDLASDLGVHAYITKPFRIAEVLHPIEAYLR